MDFNATLKSIDDFIGFPGVLSVIFLAMLFFVILREYRRPADPKDQP